MVRIVANSALVIKTSKVQKPVLKAKPKTKAKTES